MKAPTSGRNPARCRAAWLVALLCIHAGLLAWSASSSSVTFDEYAHLPAGCAYWKYRAFTIYNLSPPLLRMWGALPAVLSGASVPDPGPLLKQPLTDVHWSYGEEFLKANVARYHGLFVRGRIAMIPISCVGLWVVWLWARRLYGEGAGLAAGILYAFNPDLIAHGSLVGTDTGTAVAMLGAVYLWCRFCAAPTVRRGTAAALLVLVALLCKFTALLLWPIMVAVGVCAVAEDRRRWRPLLGGISLCALVAWAGVNAMYCGEGSFARLDSYELSSAAMKSVQSLLPAATAVPLPRAFFSGFDAQKYETELDYPAYLLGRTYNGSRWEFYPIVLACKLPVGLLALAAIAVLSALIRSDAFHRPAREELPLCAAILAFALGVASLANVNIGVRYILPIYPLSIILIARLWSVDRAVRRIWCGARWTIVGLVAIESLVAAPRFLSFANIAWGGSSNGWKVVADSNFDWGQSLIDLKRWMVAHDQKSICMAYFGRVDPRIYGIAYSPLTAPRQEPYVAISSYYLVGLSQRLPTAEGLSEFVGLPYAQELRLLKPAAVAGNTIFVYEREHVIEAARQARVRMQDGRL